MEREEKRGKKERKKERKRGKEGTPDRSLGAKVADPCFAREWPPRRIIAPAFLPPRISNKWPRIARRTGGTVHRVSAIFQPLHRPGINVDGAQKGGRGGISAAVKLFYSQPRFDVSMKQRRSHHLRRTSRLPRGASISGI